VEIRWALDAAMDMNCRVLIRQSEAVSALGMNLPAGRVRTVREAREVVRPDHRARTLQQDPKSGADCRRTRTSQDSNNGFGHRSLIPICSVSD
jgi:hypothetical protein